MGSCVPGWVWPDSNTNTIYWICDTERGNKSLLFDQVHTAVQCMFIVSISCRIPTRADYDLLLAPTAVCAQDLNMGVGICLLVGVNVLLRYSLYCNGVTKKGWGRVPDSGTLSTAFRASPFMHSLLTTSALLRGLLLYSKPLITPRHSPHHNLSSPYLLPTALLLHPSSSSSSSLRVRLVAAPPHNTCPSPPHPPAHTSTS